MRRRDFILQTSAAGLGATINPSSLFARPLADPGFGFANVTAAAGIHFQHNSGAYGGKLLPETLGSGCAFFDYDSDGWQDILFVNSMDWPGHKSGKSFPALYHNNRDGTFTDVSASAGILKENGTYGLGVLTGDFDNDGWPDIYVANDSQPSALYQNNRDGTFTDVGIMAGCAYSQDGKPQAGMGVTAGDYDCDGWLDIFKTNFSEDTDSLYHNIGKAVFDDATFAAGLGLNTRHLSWGCGFLDLNNDGWPDIFVASGHIYPEIENLKIDIHYREPKIVYLNLRNGRFRDITRQLGEGVLRPITARGCAYGDFDNDGDLDVLITTNNGPAYLYRSDGVTNHGIRFHTIGSRSNRDGIGTNVRIWVPEGMRWLTVKSGSSYLSHSQRDLTFGLGDHHGVERVQLEWPSGKVQELGKLEADRIYVVDEDKGILSSTPFRKTR